MGYGLGVTDYRAQASNIYNKVKAMFNENQLKLPSNTNNEIRDENKKKELFIHAMVALKAYAGERVAELKATHEGDNEAIAKIDACNERINGMRCWRLYNMKAQKHFFEFLCPFRPGKRYHTSDTSSPFTVVTLTDLK